MLKKIALGFVALLLLVIGYAATLPEDYVIAREQTIKASPEVLFPWINNSKKSDEWMPWMESDPQIKMTYSGPEEGVGSKASWTSPGDMGDGEALIIESIPNQTVKTQLTYTKPMEMTQLATISLKQVPEGTTVRWEVSGKNPLIGRIFCLIMNMDKMIGDEFEKGLANLKSKVEVAN